MMSEHNAIFRLSTLFRLLKRRHSSDLWAFHFLSHHTPLFNAYTHSHTHIYICDTRAYLPRNLLILFFYIFFVQSFVLFIFSRHSVRDPFPALPLPLTLALVLWCWGTCFVCLHCPYSWLLENNRSEWWKKVNTHQTRSHMCQTEMHAYTFHVAE